MRDINLINMKRMIKLITISVMIFNFHINTTSAALKGDSIRFSGKVINPEKKYAFDQISISYFDYSINYDVKRTIKRFPIDSIGSFEIAVPNIDKPYHIYIGLHSTDKTSFLNPAYNSFFIEPGDHIGISVTIRSNKALLNFSGKNSEKYNLVKKLKMMHDEFSKEQQSLFGDFSIKYIRDSIELDHKFKKAAELIYNYQAKQKQLVAKANINPSIRTLLDEEYYSYALSAWPFFRQLLLTKQPYMLNQINKIYFRYNTKFQIPSKVDTTLASSGYRYFKVISLKLVYEQIMVHGGSTTNSPEYYAFIKNNYSGSLRDRLIRNYFFFTTLSQFLNPIKFNTLDSLINDALKVVKDPILIASLKLKSKNSARKYTQNVIGAQFDDLDGKKFDIQSLRGKVVLIDVWFDGCVGCAVLNSTYKTDLYPKYESNKDFIVMSLNIDNTKKAWHLGIASGNYTSKKHLNLNTGSIGIEHPFLKFYEVRGGPWLMLINADGTIRYQPGGTGPVSATIMAAEIEAALAAKQEENRKNSK